MINQITKNMTINKINSRSIVSAFRLLTLAPFIYSALITSALILSGCDKKKDEKVATTAKAENTATAKAEGATTANDLAPVQGEKVIQKFVKPDFAKIPTDAAGESIKRGKEYLEQTYLKLPQYVGAKMNCTSCHMDSGTTQFAGPWVAITARFPQYRARSAKMDTLVDRINDCFERSLNGKRLSENSREMTDMLSYMTWLSRGYAIGQDVAGSGMPKLELKIEPDKIKGKEIYAAKCASCHQPDGAGLFAPDKKMIYPPVWGKNSFNIGAGMARLHTAAGFIKKNMPFAQGGTLTDEEAWHVAAYVAFQERPDFKKKNLDWSKGDKPKDARY